MGDATEASPTCLKPGVFRVEASAAFPRGLLSCRGGCEEGESPFSSPVGLKNPNQELGDGEGQRLVPVERRDTSSLAKGKSPFLEQGGFSSSPKNPMCVEEGEERRAVDQFQCAQCWFWGLPKIQVPCDVGVGARGAAGSVWGAVRLEGPKWGAAKGNKKSSSGCFALFQIVLHPSGPSAGTHSFCLLSFCHQPLRCHGFRNGVTRFEAISLLLLQLLPGLWVKSAPC